MKLKKLTKNFTYVNSHITEKTFPTQEIRGELKVFHFDREITSKEIIEEMKKEGYEPANIYELIEYSKNEWNKRDYVVALGSPWLYPGIGRLVSYIYDDNFYRSSLDLDKFAGDWCEDYRFLAVRKKSKSIEDDLIQVRDELIQIRDFLIHVNKDLSDLSKKL